MKNEYISSIITVVTSLLAFFIILLWLNSAPSQEFKLRLPTTSLEVLDKLSVQKVNIRGTFKKFDGKPSSIKASWSKFRGNDSDNINKEKIKLTGILKQDKLPVLWKIKLGEGYAGAAVKNGRVYVMDYNKEKQSDSLRCFSFETGKEIWQRSYIVSIKKNHGVSRTVPAVTDKYVVTIGPKCHVLCADSKTGEYKWGIDLVTEYNTRVPLWYTGQCPIIENNIAVIAPGGKSLMIGVDCESGKVVWNVPNPKKWNMSHSSIIPMTILNKKMYVYCALGGMIGVSAEKKDLGKVLWETDEWDHSVVCPSPVQVGKDRIFITSGYGVGSRMFQLSRAGNNFSIKSLYKLTKEQFACEQHTPIYYKNHLFSILPADGGQLNRQLVCISPSGRIKWTSSRENRFGLGPYIIADDKIFILDDHGVLTIAEASPVMYKQLSRVKVLHGRESWSPIVIVQGRMIIRDFEQMICLDLRKNKR